MKLKNNIITFSLLSLILVSCSFINPDGLKQASCSYDSKQTYLREQISDPDLKKYTAQSAVYTFNKLPSDYFNVIQCLVTDDLRGKALDSSYLYTFYYKDINQVIVLELNFDNSFATSTEVVTLPEEDGDALALVTITRYFPTEFLLESFKGNSKKQPLELPQGYTLVGADFIPYILNAVSDGKFLDSK